MGGIRDPGLSLTAALNIFPFAGGAILQQVSGLMLTSDHYSHNNVYGCSANMHGYEDPIKKYIRVTVVEDNGIADFGIEGLKKEISWLIPSPANDLNWKSGSSIINVDGHTALATNLRKFLKNLVLETTLYQIGISRLLVTLKRIPLRPFLLMEMPIVTMLRGTFTTKW